MQHLARTIVAVGVGGMTALSTVQYVRSMYRPKLHIRFVKHLTVLLVIVVCATSVPLFLFGGTFGIVAFFILLPLYYGAFHWVLVRRGIQHTDEEENA